MSPNPFPGKCASPGLVSDGEGDGEVVVALVLHQRVRLQPDHDLDLFGVDSWSQ